MARRLGLLLGASIIFAATGLLASPEVLPTPFMSFGDRGTALDVSVTMDDVTQISLDGTQLQFNQVVEDFESYTIPAIAGEGVTMDDGMPTLPRSTRLYRIPNTGGVDLQIVNADYEIQQNFKSYPYHEEGSGFNADRRDHSVYSRDAWYPPEFVTISEPLIMRDFRVVEVTIYPVQVNPVTHEARIYSNVSVNVVPNNLPGVNELLNPHRVSGAFKNMYPSLIANLDEDALDDVTTTPGSYLILARQSLQIDSLVDSLAIWKQRKGFDVIVQRYTSAPTPATMKTFIQTTYNNAPVNSPLEFVCIVGDPASGTLGLPTSNDLDHGFAQLDGTDDFEDVGVGRLSISSIGEMKTVIAKILGYERDPYMVDTEWFRKAFLYAGICSPEVASNYTTFEWGGQQLQMHTGVDNVNIQTVCGAVNTSYVQTQFSGGIAFFIWRGTWLGQMDPSLAATCNSGWRLPVCLTVTCGTGNFDSGLGTSESWLLAGTPSNPKGGVCGMGMWGSGTHHPPNICVAGGLYYGIANQYLEHLGNVVGNAKAWLISTFGASHAFAHDFSRWFNLMGDPGLSMWTDIPVQMTVTYSTALNVGARRLVVNVQDASNNEPIVDAIVTAWKGDETYLKGLTNSAGEIEFPIEVETAGTLMLTVTKRNHKPFLADIPCTPAGQMVTALSFTVDDDGAGGTSGNGNGIINPGETVDLSVTLKNFGTSATGTNISAVMSSANPRLTVVNANSNYPDLAPGAQAAGNSPFRVIVSDDMQNDETINLDLVVTASSFQTTSAIPITCTAGAVQYMSQNFTTPFNPGVVSTFRVTIKNTGLATLSGTTATLISQSPFVSVDDNLGTFGDIAPNAQATNTTDMFTLRANSLTFRGHQAPMSLIIQTSEGFHDTTYFVVAVGAAQGSDPTGPDGYGYYAYDNTDVTYELYPTFDYVNISGGMGTNLNLNDTGNKQSTTTVWSTVRALPFSFTYYGVTYDSVTICSNGWIAFGSQGWNDNFRNYPIPAQNAPSSMVAPYWDDLATSGSNKGVWMYYDAGLHRFIVQWKAGAGNSYSTALDFEVILLDENEYPTLDDNGVIVFQYNDVSMNLPNGYGGNEVEGSTIGIQDPGGRVGLAIAYKNQYSPGSQSNVSDGRAILITTDARALFGIIQGTITDADGGAPMANVLVTLDGFNYQDMTDASGHYEIDDVLIGEYTARAHKALYNDATFPNIIVELDSTETANMSMLHPEFALSRDSVNESIVDGPILDTSFDIINNGNGPLDYSMEVVYTGGGDPVDPWGLIEDVNVSDLTGDLQILGCEFALGNWFVSGAGGASGVNYLYRFNSQGNYLGSIPQPSNDPIGWFDLAWDGELIYGGEQGTGNIQGINLNGTIMETIPCPYVNPARAIAYDELTDHFWVSDLTTDIYEIDRSGNLISTIPNPGLQITGLAWHPTDPEDYRLYVFSMDGPVNQTTVTRIHPQSHIAQFVTILEGQDGDRAGGCAITGGWNSALLVFGAIMQNPTGDRIGIYQLDFNTTWITVNPMISSVQGGETREVAVHLDATELTPALYQVSILIYNPVLNDTFELPVAVNVIYTGVPESGENELPVDYALYQNFPNPFNPSTQIRYDLKASGQTNLTVYNIVGQKVATLVDGMQMAGSHEVHFEAAELPSGVYFYRLTSTDFSRTAKMVLMK